MQLLYSDALLMLMLMRYDFQGRVTAARVQRLAQRYYLHWVSVQEWLTCNALTLRLEASSSFLDASSASSAA